MMNIFNLLNSGATVYDNGLGSVTEVITAINGPLNVVMLGLIALMALGGIIFAVWIAFKLAKAEDEGKRKEAKSHLIYAIVGVLAAAVIFVLLTTVFSKATNITPQLVKDTTMIGVSVNQVLVIVSQAISAVFKLITIIAIGFALYIAWRLMSADEENKRKQAKAQLMWTIIAIISVILINTIISSVLASLSGVL